MRACRAALPLILASSLPAQATAVIPSTVACPSCRIDATQTVTVGRSTDSVLIVEGSTIVADSRGRFYVAPVSTPGAIAVYDRSGILLRTIGRKGTGPGEFGQIERVWVGAGDSLFVYDLRPSRLTVLSPTQQVVRTVPLQLHSRYSQVLSDGRTVVPGRVLRADRVGLPLHIYGTDGKFVRSLGAANRVVRGRPPVSITVLAPGHDDRFWVAQQGRYELELWAADGNQPVRTLTRSADWFPTHEPRIPPFGDDGTPLPRAIDLRESRSRLVWVSLVLADRDWLRSRGDERFGKQSCPSGSICPTYVPPISKFDDILDGRIEVIDPESRRVLVAREFPGPVMFVQPLLGDEALLAALREDADGYLQFGIWSARLAVPR